MEKKSKRTVYAGAVGIALALGLAMPASALSFGDITTKIQTAFTGSAETSAPDTRVSGSGSVSVGGTASGGGTRGSSSGSAGASTNGSVGTDGPICTMEAKQCPDGSYVGRTGPNCEFSACPGTSGTSSSGSSGSADGGVSISVTPIDAEVIMMTRADLSAGTSIQTRSAAEVSSNADLSGYIAAEMQNDENLAKVETSSNTVSVTYQEPARFLGFIPLSLKATATVDAQGDVSISYPWYSFLYAKADADLEAQLESRLSSVFAGSASAAGGTQLAGSAGASGTDADLAADVGADMLASSEFSAETQARIIAEVRAAMEQSFEAEVAANAAANGSVQTN